MSETTVTQNPEDLFPPRPGGMVDTARKQKQAEQDQLGALAGTAPAPGRPKIDVPVNDRAAELARARTFVVSTSASPVIELLGRDDDRRNAIIMTLDEPVVISFSQVAADDPRNASAGTAGQGASGAVIPVNVPYPVDYRGVVWCTATSDTATRVSVTAYAFTPAEG